jgi:hypothetical protein
MPIPAGFVSYIDLGDPLCYPGSGLIIEDLASPSCVWNISASGTTYDSVIGALSLTTQFVEANTLLVPTGTGPITICGWIKVNSYTYANVFNALAAVGRNASGHNFRQYPLYGGTANAVAVASATNNSSGAVYGLSEQPINEWCFVAIKKNTGTTTNQIITYLNAVNDVGGSYGTNVTTDILYNGTHSFGAINSTIFGDNQNNMSISQQWIYSSYLSDSDILDLYNATKGRYIPKVAEYSPFDNASYPGTGNTWFDLSANNNDLALSNQTFATTPIKSFSFANGYANDPTPTNLPTNIFTIDAWIKFNSTSQQILYGVGKDVGGGGQEALLIYKFPGVNSGKPFVEMGSGVGPVNFNLDPVIGQWYNITWSADGTTTRLYVDGVLDNSGAQGGQIGATSSGIILGQLIDGTGGPSGLYYSDASFGQFNIYNEALDAGTILQNYNDNVINYIIPGPTSNGVGGRQFAQGFNG